jgi:DNA (cytosine-5-)-methyltransferase
MIRLLELFGGIGAPRAALRNLGIETQSLGYVENDQRVVDSYNAIFEDVTSYKIQKIEDYSLRVDLLVHGSPCQDFSGIGKRMGADEGSNTRSSLMWETLRVIQEMGFLKPKAVIWENVQAVLAEKHKHNFDKYLAKMQGLGYKNSYKVLDARNFGLPQRRKRVFVVSLLSDKAFEFEKLKTKKMGRLEDYLLVDDQVEDRYKVAAQSIIDGIGKKGLKRTVVLNDVDCANTITTRQDRTPGQVVRFKDGYRYLTEDECFRLQGFTSEDCKKALKAQGGSRGKGNREVYKQVGNTIAVPVLEAIFSELVPLLERSAIDRV